MLIFFLIPMVSNVYNVPCLFVLSQKSTLHINLNNENLNDIHPHQVSSQNYPGALCNVTYSIPTSCEEVTAKIVAQVIQEKNVVCT